MNVCEMTTKNIDMDHLETWNVIKEIDGNVLRWDNRFVIEIDGKYYSPVAKKGDSMVVRLLERFYPNAMKELDDTEVPRCPLCGHIMSYSETYASYPHLCNHCGASVSIEKKVVVRYDTKVVEEPDIIKVE